MKCFMTLIFCAISVVSSAPSFEDSFGDTSYVFGERYNHHANNAGAGKGYASGAELTSLAHTSAFQANTAAQKQETAGNHAAFGIKNSLAQAAQGAAATAQAAVVGKQVIVQELQQQLHNAQQQLQAEVSQYNQAQQAAHSAQEANQQAQNQVNTLTAALAAAQATASHAAQSASNAANSAASQHAMVQDARNRIGQINQQLDVALSDLRETEGAAQKATAAAHVAQANAAAAANAVSSSAKNTHGGYH